MMQTVLRTVGTMDQDERRHFLESNGVEKVLKDTLAVVIEQCKTSCGERNTGFLLQAVTSGAGAGPILDEGIAVTFARMSRPRGRQTADEQETDADQPSEMEEAFFRAKEPEFRHDPAFKKFRATLPWQGASTKLTHGWSWILLLRTEQG